MGETFFGFGPPRKRLSKAVSRKQTETAPQKIEGIQKKNRALKQKLTVQIDENKAWERGDYFTSSLFFHRRFLLWHLRHFVAVAAFLPPQSLQIFICNRAF